ncbi:MAG TPA: hypothetical protein VN837_12440 [Chloroflexota bacterium]|nr:hypothetical protein [Chloroflexota bacterium]
MFWARLVGGVLLVLLGIIWIGQGLNLIKGSGMSGHGGYALVGIVVALCGLWLLWGIAQTRIGVRRS